MGCAIVIADRSNLASLEGNNRVDLNASGQLAAGTITLPDVSFLQNSLTELPENLIDTNTLLANSCISRTNRQQGSFIITGSGNLPVRPGDASTSPYPTAQCVLYPEILIVIRSTQLLLGNRAIQL